MALPKNGDDRLSDPILSGRSKIVFGIKHFVDYVCVDVELETSFLVQ